MADSIGIFDSFPDIGILFSNFMFVFSNFLIGLGCAWFETQAINFGLKPNSQTPVLPAVVKEIDFETDAEKMFVLEDKGEHCEWSFVELSSKESKLFHRSKQCPKHLNYHKGVFQELREIKNKGYMVVHRYLPGVQSYSYPVAYPKNALNYEPWITEAWVQPVAQKNIDHLRGVMSLKVDKIKNVGESEVLYVPSRNQRHEYVGYLCREDGCGTKPAERIIFKGGDYQETESSRFVGSGSLMLLFVLEHDGSKWQVSRVHPAEKSRSGKHNYDSVIEAMTDVVDLKLIHKKRPWLPEHDSEFRNRFESLSTKSTERLLFSEHVLKGNALRPNHRIRKMTLGGEAGWSIVLREELQTKNFLGPVLWCSDNCSSITILEDLKGALDITLNQSFVVLRSKEGERALRILKAGEKEVLYAAKNIASARIWPDDIPLPGKASATP